MIDYQFMLFQDLAPLQEIGLASVDVPTLDIRGSKFADVVEVLINGYPSPEFIVVSQRRLLAEIPVSQRSAEVRTVQVRTAGSGASAAALLVFDVTTNRRAEGWLKLAQTVLKVLFTTPGTDIFNPSAGGGLYSLVGSAGNAGALRGQASLAVQNTSSQIIKSQAANTSLPSSEKLKAFELLDASFDRFSATLSIRVRISAMDGTTSEIGLHV